MTFEEILKQLGFEPDAELMEGFAAFEADLYEQNAVMNLTRVKREECAIRHFADSLLFHDLIPKDSKVLDIGSGPGFPSWPLAWARKDLKITAMDSSGKMLGFQKRHALPNLSMIEKRAEEYNVAGRFDVVTGRALAPLAIQLELSSRPCREKGLVIPMRTPSDREEVERLAKVLSLELESVVERMLPVVEAPRLFPVYRKRGLTPAGYPRTWAEIKREPI